MIEYEQQQRDLIPVGSGLLGPSAEKISGWIGLRPAHSQLR